MAMEDVLYALMALVILMMARGTFVLVGVIEGLKTLNESTKDKKEQVIVLKRQAKEGLILLLLISSFAFALFLFATEGVM